MQNDERRDTERMLKRWPVRGSWPVLLFSGLNFVIHSICYFLFLIYYL